MAEGANPSCFTAIRFYDLSQRIHEVGVKYQGPTTTRLLVSCQDWTRFGSLRNRTKSRCRSHRLVVDEVAYCSELAVPTENLGCPQVIVLHVAAEILRT